MVLVALLGSAVPSDVQASMSVYALDSTDMCVQVSTTGDSNCTREAVAALGPSSKNGSCPDQYRDLRATSTYCGGGGDDDASNVAYVTTWRRVGGQCNGDVRSEYVHSDVVLSYFNNAAVPRRCYMLLANTSACSAAFLADHGPQLGCFLHRRCPVTGAMPVNIVTGMCAQMVWLGYLYTP